MRCAVAVLVAATLFGVARAQAQDVDPSAGSPSDAPVPHREPMPSEDVDGDDEAAPVPDAAPTPSDAPPHALRRPPSRAVLQLRLLYEGGYGLRSDDPAADALLRLVEARRLDLAACGRLDRERGTLLVVSILVASTGRLEWVRPLEDARSTAATERCVHDVLTSIDLRRMGERVAYWLILFFEAGPLPDAWTRTRSPDRRPSRSYLGVPMR